MAKEPEDANDVDQRTKEDVDNRTLAEKLVEPGQKSYHTLYEHISRVTRP